MTDHHEASTHSPGHDHEHETKPLGAFAKALQRIQAIPKKVADAGYSALDWAKNTEEEIQEKIGVNIPLWRILASIIASVGAANYVFENRAKSEQPETFFLIYIPVSTVILYLLRQESEQSGERTKVQKILNSIGSVVSSTAPTQAIVATALLSERAKAAGMYPEHAALVGGVGGLLFILGEYVVGATSKYISDTLARSKRDRQAAIAAEKGSTLLALEEGTSSVEAESPTPEPEAVLVAVSPSPVPILTGLATHVMGAHIDPDTDLPFVDDESYLG